MRKTLCLALCTIFVAACQAAPKQPSVKDSVINEKTFKQAMAYGVVTDLNRIETEVDKQLWLKLYRVPLLDGDCFKETHGVCKYQYLLSVSTFDENPEFNVFEFPEAGEVVKTEWLESKDLESKEIDSAKLAVTFRAFSKEALNNNKALKPQEKVISLKITPNKLVVED